MVLKEDLILPGRPQMEKIIKNHGMHKLGFMNQRDLVFDFSTIQEQLMGQLHRKFYHINWEDEQSLHFVYYDHFTGFSNVINSFNRMFMKPVRSKFYFKILDKALTMESHLRLDLLMNCTILLKQKWSQAQGSIKIKDLITSNGLWLNKKYEYVLSMKLRQLGEFTRALELSLIDHYIEFKIPQIFKAKLESSQESKLTDVLKSLKKEGTDFVRFKESFGLSFVRFHLKFDSSKGALSLSQLLEVMECDRLEGAVVRELLSVFDSLGLSSKHVIKVYRFISFEE
jgi:hypothetical protein